jgi:hypothetical protein
VVVRSRLSLSLSVLAVLATGLNGCGSATDVQAGALRKILDAPSSPQYCISHQTRCWPTVSNPTAFSGDADGGRVAVQYGQADIQVWSVPAGKRLLRVTVPQASDETTSFTLSPDGRYLGVTTQSVVTGHNLVAVWSVSSRKPILEFPYAANLVAFSTDDTHLLLVPNETVNAHGIFALSLGPLLRGVHSEVTVASTPDPPRTDPNSVNGAAFDVATQAFTLPEANITLSSRPGAESSSYGFIRWRPGDRALVTDPGQCLEDAVTADGRRVACVSFPPSLAPLAELKVWDAERRTQIAAWMPGSALAAGPRPSNNALAFLDGGRGLALEQGLYNDRPASGQILIYRIRDHAVVRRIVLAGAGGETPVQLWSVGHDLIARVYLNPVPGSNSTVPRREWLVWSVP